MSDQDKRSQVEERLARDSVERGRPVPPEGLADQIKKAIPEDLFVESGARGAGSRRYLQRWAIAASVLAAVFVGVMAFRIGVRPPQMEQAAEQRAPEPGLADRRIEEDPLSISRDGVRQEEQKAKAVPPAAQSEPVAPLDSARTQAVEPTAGQRADALETAVPSQDLSESERSMFLEPETVVEDRDRAADRLEVEAQGDTTDLGSEPSGAAPAAPEPRPVLRERATPAAIEGWVDLFLARSSRQMEPSLRDESFRDEANRAESRQVVAGRTAVIEFRCSDAASAERLQAQLRLQAARDRAMKLSERGPQASSVQLTEFRVWTRESMVERLRELEVLAEDFLCSLSSLTSGGPDR